MSDDTDRTFIGGNRNPSKYGWSLRSSDYWKSDPERIASAAALLGRDSYFKDDAGFECELIAAAIHPDRKRVVYVESRAKENGQFVDITIKIHFVDSDGHDRAVDIESYNPFFGCDVGLIEWFDDQVAILIYREKHWTFIYRLGDKWPPEFKKIEDRWQVKDNVLAYMGYKKTKVHRLSIPSLESISDISTAEAESLGLLPPDLYA